MNTVVNKEEPAVAVEETREYIQPFVNIVENADAYVMEADMPGVAKEGLTVSLEANALTIEGRRVLAGTPEGEELHRESRIADYRRVFELDPAIDSGRISAKLEQGVLTLTLPKSEAVKPRKIVVA